MLTLTVDVRADYNEGKSPKMIAPSYNLCSCPVADLTTLFHSHHSYGSVSETCNVCAFAVFEDDKIVAGFVWKTLAFNAARTVCPEAHYGVLALSRMVAVPKDERRLNHISKPLRRQMNMLIDRTRWPVLVTYSDQGEGHTGHVYKCSGWERTDSNLTQNVEDDEGKRITINSAGRNGMNKVAHSVKQRWEHWVCNKGQADSWIKAHGWRRSMKGFGKYTYTRDPITDYEIKVSKQIASKGVAEFLKVA